LACTTRDGTLRVLDARARKERLRVRAHDDWAMAAAFCRDGQCVATGGAEGALKLWTRDGRALCSAHAHRGRVTSLAISPDGRWLASTGEDALVRVYRMPELVLRATLAGHDGIVRAVVWMGSTLLSGGDDGTIRVWNAAELETRPQELMRAIQARYKVHLEDTRVVVSPSETGQQRNP
jgi:WD40 repeat protein